MCRHELRFVSGNADRRDQRAVPRLRVVCITRAKGQCRRITAKVRTWFSRSAPPTLAAETNEGRFSCPAQGAGGRRADPGAGGQAQPRGQARPGRCAAGTRRCRRRSPRPGVCRWGGLFEPLAACGVRRCGLLLDFVELLAEETGLPVGIKSVGRRSAVLARARRGDGREERGVDFVSIDGGEGGTGAAPLVFTDAVSLPFRMGFAGCTASSPAADLHEDVTFIGAGKLGLPDNAVVAFALGVDMVNVAREAMLAVGCVQAQKCHTGTCPTGVATQNRWLAHGLDPESKANG